MNWMIKTAIGMLLLAILLTALGVVFIRANAYETSAQVTARP